MNQHIGQNTDENLDELLNVVYDVIHEWSFFPETEFGSADAIIPTELLINLQQAYDKYEGSE